MKTGEIASVWIWCDGLLTPLSIPRGGTRAAFPAEPTRLRVRAGSARQGRPVGRLEEVALRGAAEGAREFRPQFLACNSTRMSDAFSLRSFFISLECCGERDFAGECGRGSENDGVAACCVRRASGTGDGGLHHKHIPVL